MDGDAFPGGLDIDDREAELDGIPEAGTCADPEATLEGEDCGIGTTLAAGSKKGADPEATAWREPEAKMVGPVFVADTELAAGTLGIVTVALLEIFRVPRALDGRTYGDVDLRLVLNMMS